ncbi:MAG: leucine--tRNA ligase [Verrucomicrobia bacterium]|nr:leucine--tRNA ligase [Verrucomicrobiota bacterium]
MSSTRRQYPFHLIEPKWQQQWDVQATFRAWSPGERIPAAHPFGQRHGLRDETATTLNLPPKFYVLDMFPYPSGAGLHVGHPEGYTATDILARYRRAAGFNVLHPIGWDAFGLPAEQYAVKTGQHPRVTTEANITTFRRQIKSLGFSYDWQREIDTTDPRYFRWTQWIFLQLYHSWFNPASNRAEPIESLPYPAELKSEPERRVYRDGKRLAYVSDAPVWWCDALGTVLANEEVIDGKSEVGGFPVVRRPMRQWMLRITAYAERLLQDLQTIDWSDSLKEMQRNWIGRSEGADVTFTIDAPGLPAAERQVTVFTTRPDTLFGATYMVLAPEHRLVDAILPATWPANTPVTWKGQQPGATQSPQAAVAAYRAYAAARSDRERTDLAKEKTGVFTGAYAFNPANGERIPVWIADYVLLSYGTGAIMAVPAHDTRDLEFARAFNLPIRTVVQAPGNTESIGFVDDGISVNSGFITGLPTPDAKRNITDWLVQQGLGQARVNYKLRDWLFSRQRYWGEPFPIVWKPGPDGEPFHEALPESELPLLPPPLDDFKPTNDGRPPLARATDWLNLAGAQRETNTMPQWAGSCWYYLRYLDPANDQAFCRPAAERYWMGSAGHPNARITPGVDLYVGGTEHAVLHLLYARFWHKVLFDLGHVSTPEPFYKLVNQGLILGEDGQKMSKSRGNVINPDDILKDYGADAFRLYEMFLGPLEMTKPWSTRGVEGVYRFLGRVWRLCIDESSETEFEQRCAANPDQAAQHLEALRPHPAIQATAPDASQLRVLHACIRKVTEDLDHLRFNTAISALMVFVNEAIAWDVRPLETLRTFLVLLHPFAPHLAEELWQLLDTQRESAAGTGTPVAPNTIAYLPWPRFDPALLVEETLEIPVQVNGKLRDRIRLPADTTPAQVELAALAADKIAPLLRGKTLRKIIVVPGKLVNLVVSP